MARKAAKQVEALTHEESSRKNIPTAEYQSLMAKDDPVEVAYERCNRDPQLVWRGKDPKDWSDLVVQAPPLFIQEKVHPKALIDDLIKRGNGQRDKDHPDLFADFNGLPDDNARTEFYRHDANWTNRMILGDALQVMASLTEREELRGQVQCIYVDPPYGVQFEFPVVHQKPRREGQGRARHARTGAGEGVPRYLEGRYPFLSDVFARPADGGA